ncbi:hypothetical protein GCM10007067_15140 [Lysobacter bugurensis]|uniref:Transposase IS200-like domain-containing protein n=1 Tax=Cognatilysobacter bugurensis TaxID=543356 RepID=A0A918W6M9_9GAMM|nr:hypothetical protein GCM10007067_15140 [Lysobacter bugurensis]
MLMTNHVHLLVTPAEPDGVSRMMQATGRRYVAGFNARYWRTRTLWEGRFKSALVGSDEYVLACYRYIELNPVRAAMVVRPDEHCWSSYPSNAAGVHDVRITPHEAYRRLATTERERQAAYAALVAGGIDIEHAHDLAVHTQQQKPWGTDRFRRQIKALTGRAVNVRPKGRPAQRPPSPQPIKST